ncbi:uncharacterized protein BO66DRAFT_388790 [Aspergillus aculeatinus CBS 121060]|uniref:Uncharacterized protein n=1 Tax=Aspergillus aculeatinus CBS 121060 TaxID=1448322 RepID=A0ACD1HJ79_9EURO|nr:hypothetical protein BO66DRAFT_388790 [Aspergillus aculeatinus CBS 121060]RAH73683.1 hypothetical protein BO66DRAFT_388790 [Aspergillus aculeatinus CBS 121060]
MEGEEKRREQEREEGKQARTGDGWKAERKQSGKRRSTRRRRRRRRRMGKHDVGLGACS